MSKFTIIKGRPYYAEIVIKETGSYTGVTLNTGDTATFTVVTIGSNPKTVIDRKTMNPIIGSTGTFILELTDIETKDLVGDTEFGEDGYPLSATYRGLIDADVQGKGHIYGTIPQIYVEETGI